LLDFLKNIGVVSNGVQFDQMLRVDNWEFMFATLRVEGLLPVVKHALYIP